MEISLNFTIFTYMKIRTTDNQLYVECAEKILKGKELALQILGSGLGVTSIKQGTLIVFELSKTSTYIFQIKNDLNVFRLNDASYISYLAGSVVDLGTGRIKETLEYAPRFKKCRLPSPRELERYEKFNTI